MRAIALLTTLLALAMLAASTPGAVAETPAGTTMDLDERQGEADRAMAALAGLIAATDPDAAAIAAAAEALAPLAGAVAEEQRRRCAASSAELAGWLAGRDPPTVAGFAAAPVVLYGNATEAEVVGCWSVQLRCFGAALTGLLADDGETNGIWLYWGDLGGARAAGKPFFRAEQARDCVLEIRKLARALAGPRRVERVAAGPTIAEDGFAGDLSGWRTYGAGTFSARDGTLAVDGAGCSLWCEREFTDAVVSFDYRPVASRGEGSGALFAFPGTPVAGLTYEASSGPMEDYNRGIDTYHVSLYRSGGPMSNLRRTGPGLKMLSSVRPDPCVGLGRTYRLELVKRGESVQVHVDGVLVHAYVDAGVYGPCLRRGRFGMRLFSAGALLVELRRFAIRELVSRD